MAVPVYQIRGIELQELVIKLQPSIPDPSAILNFEVKIDSNVDPAQKQIILLTTIRIINENQDTELGHILCACWFSVNNFNDVVTIKNGKDVHIDPTFSDTLNSIAISTTRGVMFGELKGTRLHMALLPLVDVKTLKKAEVAVTESQGDKMR